MYDSNFKLINTNPKVKKVSPYGPESSHEHRRHHRMQVVYTRQMRERRLYMDELKEYRKYKDKQLMRNIIKSIGPSWYQALSCTQRAALDSLKSSIYQDILEARPRKTAKVIRVLGIYPKPSASDLMSCIIVGRDDPKAMLAHLFLTYYGHSFDGKKSSYCLNARFMLSGILYLGLDNLIELLKEKFSPNEPPSKSPSKIKQKRVPKLDSPYLQTMVAALYEAPVRKPYRPTPLPNMDELNEPYEEDPPIPKPPPPPPPPPPPKKRLPLSYCEKLAGIERIEPYKEPTCTTVYNKKLTRSNSKKIRTLLAKAETKKKYGMSGLTCKKSHRIRKPFVPSTGMWNAQYTIRGVHIVRGKAVFVLDNVSILPPAGDMIHGGYAIKKGENVNIHCGMRGIAPPLPAANCDCLKKWQNAIFEYLENTKCYCRHYYDFNNEGPFPPENVPYFQKPTRTAPYAFNYNTIYNIDEKSLHIEREFKSIWETDSMLQVNSVIDDAKDKKKKKKRLSTACLGEKPKPEDYLQCALRLLRRQNIAARLPDVHKVPELKEWMRYRLYGPLTPGQRANTLRISNHWWTFFKTLDNKYFGHVEPPYDPQFSRNTNWLNKQKLNDRFRKYVENYRFKLFKTYAYINNLMWSSMFHDKFPDRKFREIYFSYLFGRVEDLMLIHPYTRRETLDRATVMSKRRYRCLPAGIETNGIMKPE